MQELVDMVSILCIEANESERVQRCKARELSPGSKNCVKHLFPRPIFVRDSRDVFRICFLQMKFSKIIMS